MQAKEKLINILADGKFYSGETLGQMLGISRSAVWKYVQSLGEYQIDVHAVSGKGYRFAQPVEMLNPLLLRDEIANILSPEFGDIDVLLDVDSTNRFLLDKARSGYRRNAVCFAEFQRAGRGRRGREWKSPFACNVYSSVLWHSRLPLNMLSPLSLVIGVAVAHALKMLGLIGHKIKWPNDIHWNDKKLGGILIETAGEISSPGIVVIGVGLNVAMPDALYDEIDQPSVDLKTALGANVSRNAVASALIKEMALALTTFEREGFDRFWNDWASYDLLRDRELQLHFADKTITGLGAGVDNQGALLVKHADSSVARYFSGDVSVRYSV